MAVTSVWRCGAGSWLALAAIMALGIAVAPVSAADFGTDAYRAGNGKSYDKSYGRDRFGDYRYDDPYDRYADRGNEQYDDYDDTYDRRPYRGSLKDGGVGYGDKSYKGEDFYRQRHYGHNRTCLPQRAILRKLRRAGWRGFRRGRVRGDIGYVHARQRYSGEIYELAVDRCSGEIISATCIGDGYRRPASDFASRW